MIRLSVLILTLFGLTSCVNLGPQQLPATQSYDISAAVTQGKVQTCKPVRIMVNKGTALPGYTSDRMVYQRGSHAPVQAYAYHRWLAPPVTLITPQVTKALLNSHAFKAVILGNLSDAKVDKDINVQLVKLQQNVAGNDSEVVLVLNVNIIEDGTYQLVAAKQFEAHVKATANAEGMVNGTNQALTMLLPQIVQFSIASI